MARHRSGLPFHEPLPDGVANISDAICKRLSAEQFELPAMDRCLASFSSASRAIEAAREIIVELALSALSDGLIGVAVGVCTGEGPAIVDRAMRLATAAEAEQILVDSATREISAEPLGNPYGFHELTSDMLDIPGDPMAVHQVLHQQLRRVFREARSLDHRPDNLPRRITSFIGRAVEIEELAELLQEHRSISIIGAGGVGKTSLAARAALERLEDYPDGAHYVDFREFSTEQPVWESLAASLGLRIAPNWSVEESVRYYLGGKDLLLILDSAELHADELRRVVPILLKNSRALQVLIASRVPIRLVAEVRYVLGPMSMVSVSDHGTDSDADALRLFEERASAVRPNFRISQENLEDVKEICRRLDGNPLAIELAAARASTLSAHELLVDWHEMEMDEAIEATVSWSVGLLSAESQRMFRRLSLLKGDITVKSAQAVSGASSSAATRRSLGELVDARLLSPGDPIFPGEQILRMSSHARGLAAKQLESCRDGAEAENLRNRWISGFAKTANQSLTGPDQDVWRLRFERLLPDIEAAALALIARGDRDSAAEILSEFRTLWSRAPGRAPMRALEAFLKLGHTRSEAELRVKASLATVLDAKNAVSRARRLFLETYLEARSLGLASVAGSTLSNLGRMYRRLGRMRRSAICARRALRLFEEVGDRTSKLSLLLGMASVLKDEGQIDEAKRIYDRVEAEGLQKDRFLQAYLLSGQAGIEEKSGHPARGAQHMLRAVRISVDHGFDQELAGFAAGLARMELAAGEPERALRILASVRGACSRREAFLSARDMETAESVFAHAAELAESTAFLPQWEQLSISEVLSTLYPL